MSATAVLTLALLACSGTAIWSAFVTGQAAQAAARQAVLAEAYSSARFAIAAEESLERKYRLEQGGAVRAAHAAAKADVDRAMRVVQRLGEADDRALARETLARNEAYFKASLQLLAAADRHDVPAELRIDHSVVDPPFTVMQDRVYSEANDHLQVAGAARQRLLSVESVARWATSLAAAFGLTLIAVFLLVQRRLRGQTEAQARQLAYQATHDALTGLPNRLSFGEDLDAAVAATRDTGGSVAVALLDLDRFKEINDTLGHAYGDKLLQQVGPRLGGLLRPGQALGRLGGDEFALLLPADQEGVPALDSCLHTVRAALAALREPFIVDEVKLAVEASAGIAISGLHGDGREDLLTHADIAMYLAKSNHETLAVYDPTLDGHSPRRLALLSQLRDAVDGAQLVVHYQPLIELETNTVIGAEALVRWEHPDEGLLPPAQFIPLAEGSGLIHELTRHVLADACRQARAWLDDGHPLEVSVNISPRCLLDLTLSETVAETLADTGLPPALLKLEITESAIIGDHTRAFAVIARLHQLGVSLSIDDFGTGYTSLSYLRDLPVAELKIDRSFVMRMLSDSRDAVIVRSGIELATRLGLRSVAEGIENADVLTALRALACTIGQGYHLGRPMPPTAFASWLADHHGERLEARPTP